MVALLVLFVLETGEYHFVRRRLEDGHLTHGWKIFIESSIRQENLRRRHHRMGSLRPPFVPEPTQDFQVSPASPRQDLDAGAMSFIPNRISSSRMLESVLAETFLLRR